MQYKKWIAAALAAVMLTTGVGATQVAAAEATSETDAPTFTVTDPQYGAVNGDESTAAFQKALDDAALAATEEKPATVIVPAGTYYMNATLIINSNVTLKCDPQAVIKKLDVGYTYMLRSALNGVGGFGNVRNITIEGGTWDAMYYRAQEDTGGSHMYIAHGENITFRGVTYKNNYGAHMIEVGGVRNLLVENCTFDGFEMYRADASEDGPEKEAVQLDVVHSTKMMPNAEPYDDTPCVNVTVRNNRFYNCSRGFGTHSAVKGVYIENVLVENNYFENLTDQAVYTYRFLNLTVRNNTIKNAACGVMFKTRHSTGTSGWYEPLEGVRTKTADNYKVLIENNIITTTNDSVLTRMQQYGIWVYGIEGDKVSGCTIRNNTVNSASCGIYANFADDVTISGNVIKRINATTSSSFSADGIKAKSSARLKIQNNSLLANAGNRFEAGIAIRTDCTGAIISGNRVASNTATDHGILAATASSAAISGNTVSGVGGHGIYINACNTVNSITGNTVSNVGKNGILLNYAKASKVDNNTVSNSKSHGIDLTLATATSVNGNRLSTSGGSGISLTDSTVDTINKNTVQQNKAYGIKLDKSSAKTIADNTVSKNTKSGIFFNNFSKLSNLYGNTISGNGYSGIDFDNWSSAASVYNNTIPNSKKDGITVKSGAEMTSVYSNKITDSGRHGVSAYQAAVITYLKSNTITNPKTNGVSLDASTVIEITANTISGAKNNGIYLTMRADATTISDNTLSKNKQGIWAQQNSTVKTIQNNTVSTTKQNGIFIGTGSTADTIEKNTVQSSGSHGVYFRTGKITTFTNNTISGGKGYGLYATASTVNKVSGNKISKNNGGVYFSGATVKSIQKNTLTDNGTVAVKAYSTSKCVKPTELTVKRIKKGAKKITGTTAAKVKITVKLQGKTYKKKADKKGKFTIKVKSCKKKQKARFTLTYGGNTVQQTVTVG